MSTLRKITSKIDGSFSDSQSERYDLTVLVGEESTSWSVYDGDKQRYILLESFDNTLSELDEGAAVLKLQFRDVKIILESNISTLIPEPLFDPTETSSYLHLISDRLKKELCFFNRLDQLEIVNVFMISEKIDRSLDLWFPGKPQIHLNTILIDSIWSHYKNRLAAQHLFLYVREEDFNIVIFEKNQLTYCNSFHFKTPEDLLYFLIFVMEQLKLNPEEVPVTVYGRIEKDNYLFELLYRYVRNITFGSRIEGVSFSYVFDDVPDHAFYPLLTRVV